MQKSNYIGNPPYKNKQQIKAHLRVLEGGDVANTPQSEAKKSEGHRTTNEKGEAKKGIKPRYIQATLWEKPIQTNKNQKNPN